VRNTSSWEDIQAAEFSGKVADLLLSSALITEVLLYGNREVLMSVSTLLLIKAYGCLAMCMLLVLS